MQFVRSSGTVLVKTLQKCTISVSGASVSRNVGPKGRSFRKFSENSTKSHLFSPNKAYPNFLPNKHFSKDCFRKETTLKKLQHSSKGIYHFSTTSGNDKNDEKALVWVKKGYDDGKRPKGEPEEDDGDLSDYIPKKQAYGWFARRRKRLDEQEKIDAKQETDRHAKEQRQQHQQQSGWSWIFGRRVPRGLEYISFGTWEAVFDPISSRERIMAVVKGTLTFIVICEVIGFGIEGVSPILPLTFQQSNFFPMINRLIYSDNPSIQWFAIRAAYASTSHDEIRIWGELFPVNKATEIISKEYDSIMELNGTLKKIPGKYMKKDPTEMEYHHALYRMNQTQLIRPLTFEEMHTLVDEIKESADSRELETKKLDDAAFFFQNFSQYSSLLEGFSTEPVIHVLSKFCRTRVADYPESYLLQLLSTNIMDKHDRLERLKELNRKKNAMNISTEGTETIPVDPIQEDLERELNEIIRRTNEVIMHADNVAQSQLRLRNMAVASFANMARSSEVRKRLVQEAIPYQLIRIRESTQDPELRSVCEEALGNLLTHDKKDTEYFGYIHKQLKEPIRFSDENKAIRVIKLSDEDLDALSLLATEKQKLRAGGFQMRAWEIGVTFVFGYFYARARWGIFLRFFQKLKGKKLKRHIKNFRSPHTAVMGTLLLFQFDRALKSHWFGDEFILKEMARFMNQVLTFNFFVFSIALAPYCIVPSLVGSIAVGAVLSSSTDHFVDDLRLSGHVRHMKHHQQRDLETEPGNLKDAIEIALKYIKSLIKSVTI